MSTFIEDELMALGHWNGGTAERVRESEVRVEFRKSEVVSGTGVFMLGECTVVKGRGLSFGVALCYTTYFLRI